MEAEQLMQMDAPESFQEIRHGFEINNNRILIPKSLYSEVINRPRICPIPATPDWFRGFMNHRGDTVPVYDLSLLFTQSEEADTQREDPRWVLLLDEQPFMAGLLLQAPPSAVVAPETAAADAENTFEASLRGSITSCLQHNDTLWAELDHRQFFESLKKHF